MRWDRSVKFLGHDLRSTNFTLGWNTRGYARQFDAENAYCANDFAGCGRLAEAMRMGVERIMECLRLLVDARKTHRLRVPEQPLAVLVSCVGRNYPQIMGASRDRPQDLSQDRRVDASAYDHLDAGTTALERLNRAVLSWAHYFYSGSVSPGYKAIDAFATKRLSSVGVPEAQGPGEDAATWTTAGGTQWVRHLRERTASSALAKAWSRTIAGWGKPHDQPDDQAGNSVPGRDRDTDTTGTAAGITAALSTLDSGTSRQSCRSAKM